MKNNNAILLGQAPGGQSGMTLIELSVVLLVLIGLAGLLIPYVSGFVGKTHDSTGTNNLANLDNSVQRYHTQFMGAPNNMEALINGAAATAAAAPDCTGAAADAVYCKMMHTGFFATATVDSAAGMTTAERIRFNSLNMAGITSLYYNNPDTGNATFQSTLGTPTTLEGAAHTIATVAAAEGSVENHMAAAFGRPANNFDSTCYDYVAFGIGDGSSMSGRVMSTAPVHFASQGSMGPVNKYNRFIAVYQVDKLDTAVAAGATNSGCTAGMEAAKFIGTAMAMGSGAGHLWGTAHSLSHSYENIANN
ncbi:prepilin-type N-terminal cleavage/methylation domain-containing protein [Methylocaldum sp.]|uniref:type II secretion system protein n=1 Tax=Methylocaldum sp. TaxID=1969727 RepID=UPI002D409B0F|nr:prepilin-type N-terminal cleavage/methylation domain-containing protein [Methylocaldum sp.]HYE36079.1 prepilin-type N-terminal cleavage/methylation domain-containing protein [Methylocaldum sp.]